MRIYLSLLTAALLASGAPAEVFEYTPQGAMTVLSGQDEDRAGNISQADSGARGASVGQGRLYYRAMAEQLALKHAGSAGVRAAGLDALTFTRIFVALIDRESRFDPRAVSPAGAMGLGQLMPATARQLAVRDPFDPVQNLEGAATYFTRQLARFKDVRLALAAYNAGPHRVGEYGGIPPFRETRDYVAAITAEAGRGVSPRPASSFSPPPHQQTNRSIMVWEF